MHENSIWTAWEILSRSCYYHGAPTILTIINVTVFVKLKKLLNHRTADLLTFDVFFVNFFFSIVWYSFPSITWLPGRCWTGKKLKSNLSEEYCNSKKKTQTKKATHTSIKKGLLRGLLLVSEVIICQTWQWVLLMIFSHHNVMQGSGEYVYWGGQRDPFFTVNQFFIISIIGFNVRFLWCPTSFNFIYSNCMVTFVYCTQLFYIGKLWLKM